MEFTEISRIKCPVCKYPMRVLENDDEVYLCYCASCKMERLMKKNKPPVPFMYIYEIQAFAYSDFEHHILLHERKFKEVEFRKMIEMARQKAKKKYVKKWYKGKLYYPMDVIQVLIEDYGFVRSKHLVGYVGGGYDDICEVDLE